MQMAPNGWREGAILVNSLLAAEQNNKRAHKGIEVAQEIYLLLWHRRNRGRVRAWEYHRNRNRKAQKKKEKTVGQERET